MAEAGGSQKAAGDNQISHNQMDVNECLASWLTYLQVYSLLHPWIMSIKTIARVLIYDISRRFGKMLNGLCSAGTKLALSLQALLSVHESMAQCRLTGQCLAGWEELTRATNVASHTVKKHVVAAMKDLRGPRQQRRETREYLLYYIPSIPDAI